MSVGVIPGVKSEGAVKLKSSPSNVEFKNECRNISIFLANLHGANGGHLYPFYNGLKFISIVKQHKCIKFILF